MYSFIRDGINDRLNLLTAYTGLEIGEMSVESHVDRADGANEDVALGYSPPAIIEGVHSNRDNTAQSVFNAKGVLKIMED